MTFGITIQRHAMLVTDNGISLVYEDGTAIVLSLTRFGTWWASCSGSPRSVSVIRAGQGMITDASADGLWSVS